MKFKPSILLLTSTLLQTICADDVSSLKDAALFNEFLQVYGETFKQKFAVKSDLQMPYFIGSISSNAQSFYTGFISSSGTTAYIPTINNTNVGSSLYPWVSVFDVSTPGTITFKGTCAITGINDNSSLGVWINTKGTVGIIPVINGGAAACILDFSVPGSVSVSATISTPSDFSYSDFLLGNQYAIVNYGGAKSVGVIDYSTYNSLTPLNIAQQADYLIVKATTSYVASGDSGVVTAIDVSDPTNITKLSDCDTGFANSYFLIANPAFDALYVLSATDNKLATLNISNPSSLTVTSTLALDILPREMLIKGTAGYVTCQGALPSQSKVIALNLSNPLVPVISGSATTGGYGANLSGINGSVFYVANLQSTTSPTSEGCIGYLDISTPGSISFSGTLPSGGIYPYNFVIEGTTGYISNKGDAGTNPASVGYFFAPDYLPSPTPPVPPAPTTLPAYSGNLGSIGNMLTSVYNQPATPAATNAIATGIFEETNPLIQQKEMVQLLPGFKIIQYSLEKQDLLLHKEVERELYEKQNKSSFFMLAGYDNLTQKSKGVLTGLNGYNVNTPYQMIGFNQKYSKLKLIEAISGSESFMQVSPAHARASFYTVWGDIGIAYVSSKWQIGLDGQYGYSFLNTKRYIDYLGLKTTSNHNAWNASGLLRIGYDIVRDNSSVTPYNNLSYIYGRENNYTESGAPGANLNVKDETISTIRNQAGFKIKKPVSRYAHILFDGAWLYEKYLNDQNYSAAFAGTSVFGRFKQIVPTKNYARIEAGFIFRKDRLDLEFIYTGLYGRKFSESSGSMKFGYKY